MPHSRLFTRALPVALLVAAAAACGDSSTAAKPSTPQAAAIFLDSASLTLAVGADHQLIASVTDASGAPVSETVSWNSTDASVVSVTQSGLVHGIAPGTATVTAVAGPHIALSKVTVVAAP